MKRVISGIIMTLTLLASYTSMCQTYNFKTSSASVKRTAADFRIHGFPDTLKVWGNEFDFITSNPASWGNDIKLKSNNSFVSFYIDHAYHLSQRPFTYKLTYQVFGYANPADTTLYSLINDTLVISNQNNYDPRGAFQDLQTAKFSGYYKTMVIVTNIYDMATNTPVDLTDTLKWNYIVESSIITQKYDKKHDGTTYYGNGTSLEVSQYPNTNDKYLNIYFNFDAGDTSHLLLTPVNYELEWAYVDNYQREPSTGTISSKSPSSLKYDFTSNSTRVWLKDNRYKIPLVYPNGYLVYRVRMVRPDSLLYQYPIASDWSYNTPDAGSINDIDDNCKYEISSSVSHDSLNWQYTISFAEDGKYKQVMSFYDGLLKNRESITRFNSEMNRLIVTRNIYDFEGRPSIVTLPAPVLSSSFSYLHNVDLAAATNLPYRAGYFDTGLHSCPVDPDLSPLAGEARGNIYYSSDNHDTTGVQKYVPDAQGFPFVHTIYNPLISNRVEKQGGAGPRLQIADSNIITNYYVGAEESFTNKLFGINAGWKNFYNKTVSKDQNQQLSLSVKNHKGEVAATALIGRGGNPADHAITPIGVPDSTSYHEDLLANAEQTMSDNTRIADYEHFSEAAGNDSLQYILNMPLFPVCDQFMSLRAHYLYNITDQCGNKLYEEDSTIGVSGFVSSPTSYTGPIVSLHLEQGPYSIHKSLSFYTSDIDSLLNTLFNTPNCFRTVHSFIRESVESVTFPCSHRDNPAESCADKEAQMLAELHPGAKYGQFAVNDSSIVVGTDNSIFTRTIYDSVYNSSDVLTYLYRYRYQDTCTAFTLPDTIAVGGIFYSNLRTMPADSFIMIYNESIGSGDPIAHALLPLHPEYCKLLNCFDDTFKTKLQALYNADMADSQHLLYLDSIVAHDPAISYLAGSLPSPADSLLTYRGGHIRLDSFELMIDYCSCSDSVMFNECVSHIYNYEITHRILANTEIRAKYFSNIISRYLDNRQRFIDMQVGSVINNCPHCSDARMDLIPMPVFPAIDTIAGVAFLTPTFPGDTSWSGLGFASTFLTSYSSLVPADSMTDSLLAYYDSAAAIGSAADSMLCNGQINNIMERLANCGNGDTTILNGIRHTLDSLCAAHAISMGAYTPELIRYAITRNGAHIEDFCNPYLILYGSIMPQLTVPDGSCRTDSFYRSVRAFLNRPEILLALRNTTTLHTTTLNTTSSIFDNSLYTSIGATDIQCFATYSAARSIYKLKLYSNPSSAITGDSVTVYMRDSGSIAVFSLGDSVKIPAVACISTAPSFVAPGAIRNFSFVTGADVYTGGAPASRMLLSWTDTVITTNAGNNPLAECVPCTQMKELYKEFTDTLYSLGIWGTDHPYYYRILMSFMNNRLGSTYDDDQYETFIESCALADSMALPQYLGYVTAAFANNTHAAAFIDMLNEVDTTIEIDGYFADSTTGRRTVRINFNALPENSFWKYRNAIRNYSGSYIALVIDTAYSKLYLGESGGTPPASFEVGYLYCPEGATMPSAETVFGSGTTFSFAYGGVHGLWTGNGYTKKDYYTIVSSATPQPYLLSRNVYEMQRYIYNNSLPFTFYPNYKSCVNKDYYEPRKQEFLAYTYAHQALPPYEVLDSLQSQYLLARIPGYSGKDATYISPANPGIVTNLFIADASMMGPGLDTLKHILQVVEDTNTVSPGHIFFTPDDVSITYNGSLHAYKCSDGTYWYRYFGAGDTMWNVHVVMPPWVPRSAHTHYTIVSSGTPLGVIPSLGDSTTKMFILNLQHDVDGTIIQARGLASFVIGHNLELNDVLLGNPLTERIARREASINNCETDLRNAAQSQGIVNYNHYMDSVKNAIRTGFMAWVNSNIEEHLYLSYLNQQFQYTLYYYDRAGNLNATVPPAGVEPLAPESFDAVNNARAGNYFDAYAINSHKKVSLYEHNTLNQVVKQVTPDGGTVSFIYDYAGRLLFSQNEKQYPGGYYTYNLYDRQNRIIETGEAKLGCPYFDEYLVDIPHSLPDCYFSYPDTSTGIYLTRVSPYSPIIVHADELPHDSVMAYIYSVDRRDAVHTIYDTQATNLAVMPGLQAQENLRKRVAAVKYFRSLSPLDTGFLKYQHATHYSYDIAGNVKTLVQDYPRLEFLRQRFKRVDYDYDLISGKVNMLSYNRSYADQYYQRYNYDADNRITKVETSGDGIVWHRDAEYTYYPHGPLARVELGELRVQGIDYAYTIQGWLKAVNADSVNPAIDMGRDGRAGIGITARDAVGFAIDYFKNDYKPVGDWDPMHVEGVTRNLYNGNIARQTMAYTNFQKLHKQYVYDQLNRLSSAQYATIAAADSVPAFIPDYTNSYEYDADGNILKLLRYGNNTGTGAHIMDSLTYAYTSGVDGYTANQLKGVMDEAPDSYTNDVKFNTSGLPSYLYDKIGNTTKDLVSGQDSIKWNLYNKVTETRNISDSNWLNFDYDAMGNRVGKIFTQKADSGVIESNDYYVRDASGNILATYHADARYKSEQILWIDLINEPYWTVAGHRGVVSGFVAPVFAANENFHAAVMESADKSEDFKATVLYKPVSYFLNQEATYTNMMGADPSYVVPLVEYEMADNTYVVSNAVKKLGKDSKAVAKLLGSLMSDSLACARTLQLLCDAGANDAMSDMLAYNGLAAGSANCMQQADMLMRDRSGMPDVAKHLYIAAATRTIGLDAVDYAVVKEMYDDNALNIDSIYHYLGSDSATRTYIIGLLCDGQPAVLAAIAAAYGIDTTVITNCGDRASAIADASDGLPSLTDSLCHYLHTKGNPKDFALYMLGKINTHYPDLLVNMTKWMINNPALAPFVPTGLCDKYSRLVNDLCIRYHISGYDTMTCEQQWEAIRTDQYNKALPVMAADLTTALSDHDNWNDYAQLLVTDTLLHDSLLIQPKGLPYIYELQNALTIYANQGQMLQFFDQYQGAWTILNHVASQQDLLNIAYHNNPVEFLCTMDSLMGHPYIDSAIAAVPSLEPQPYAAMLMGAVGSVATGTISVPGPGGGPGGPPPPPAGGGGPGGSGGVGSGPGAGTGSLSTVVVYGPGGYTVIPTTAPYAWGNIIQRTNFYLSGHDIYGSSRLQKSLSETLGLFYVFNRRAKGTY